MANTIVNGEYFSQMTQVFLRANLVAMSVANTRFEANITPGQQIHFPYAADVRVQDYTFSTDADIDSTVFTDDTLTVNQKKIATVNYDPMQNLQAHGENWMDMLSEQAAYQVARKMDQHFLSIGTAGASSTVSVGGQFTVANVAEKFGAAKTALARNRAGAGRYFAIVEPGVVDVLARADIANGFNRADRALNNGYVGDTNYGFRVYESDDLPCTVTLTVDTQPTAADTFTVYGVTFTCVADGTAASAGEVNIGANLADFKTIFVDVINGVNAGTDYVDVATDDRRQLQGASIAAATFVGNDCVITGFGRMGGEETFTAATNVFGTETCDMLFGLMGAVDFVAQQAPQVTERDEPKNLSKNILVTALYQAKVFNRNTKRLVKVTADLD